MNIKDKAASGSRFKIGQLTGQFMACKMRSRWYRIVEVIELEAMETVHPLCIADLLFLYLTSRLI